MQKQEIPNVRPGLLWKTKFYLVGAMEADETGEEWRKYVMDKCADTGIIFYSPYVKPFINDAPEDNATRAELKKMLEDGEYEKVSAYFKQVRAHDLALVDKSDAIIFNYNPEIPTIGSWEECFWANRLKKPIFMSVKGGIKKAGLWTLGTIPYKYIYSSLDDVINMVKKINNGEVPIDSDRWRLLNYEFR